MTNTSSNAQCIIVVYNSPSVTFDLPIPQASSIQQMPFFVLCLLLPIVVQRAYREEANRSIVRESRALVMSFVSVESKIIFFFLFFGSVFCRRLDTLSILRERRRNSDADACKPTNPVKSKVVPPVYTPLVLPITYTHRLPVSYLISTRHSRVVFFPSH